MHPALTKFLANRFGHWATWQSDTDNFIDHDENRHFGSQTGNGWYALQERLFRWWELRQERWILTDIKEKFGTLAIHAYSEACSPSIDERAIRYVRIASSYVCECCAAPGRLAQSNGWYSTLCVRHLSKSAQEHDDAEVQVCTDVAEVLATLDHQCARGPEPSASQDFTWCNNLTIPEDLGTQVQHLDGAITWLLEQNEPRMHRSLLDSAFPFTIGNAINRHWPKDGLPTSALVQQLHAELQYRLEQLVHQHGRCPYYLVHMPEVFILPR